MTDGEHQRTSPGVRWTQRIRWTGKLVATIGRAVEGMNARLSTLVAEFRSSAAWVGMS